MSEQSSSAGDLANQRCRELPASEGPLPAARAAELLARLSGWESTGIEIAKTFHFKNYYQTIAFVNAIAWVSHQQDHHPDLEVGYNRCRARYSTHSVGGLSENDFICAARIDALLQS